MIMILICGPDVFFAGWGEVSDPIVRADLRLPPELYFASLSASIFFYSATVNCLAMSAWSASLREMTGVKGISTRKKNSSTCQARRIIKSKQKVEKGKFRYS